MTPVTRSMCLSAQILSTVYACEMSDGSPLEALSLWVGHRERCACRYMPRSAGGTSLALIMWFGCVVCIISRIKRNYCFYVCICLTV